MSSKQVEDLLSFPSCNSNVVFPCCLMSILLLHVGKDTRRRVWFSILYSVFKNLVFRVILRRWHLAALNVISQVCDQSTSVLRSCCSVYGLVWCQWFCTVDNHLQKAWFWFVEIFYLLCHLRRAETSKDPVPYPGGYIQLSLIRYCLTLKIKCLVS